MRILGFSRRWQKLSNPEFTTFRFPRKDSDKGRDWHLGETVKIVYQPRHEHKSLGIAGIISKELTQIISITEQEAIDDGFNNRSEMWVFLGKPPNDKFINKLTLKWIEREK